MIFIAGATGHTGSVAARELLSQGKKVRVLARSADKAAALAALGAEVVVGELSDTHKLTAALTGVEAAFLLLPPPSPPPATATEFYAWQRQLADGIAAAVAASKAPYVVLLSSFGAQHPDGTGPIKGLHYFENKLAATGTKLTRLRACSFLENLGGMLGAVQHMGALPNFFAETLPVYHVATHDIGLVAAKSLADAPGDRTINIVGPHPYTAVAQAAAWSAAVGKEIKLMNLPDSAAAGALVQAGLPQSLADVYAEMYQGVNKGLVAFPAGGELVHGTTTMESFLAALVKA